MRAKVVRELKRNPFHPVSSRFPSEPLLDQPTSNVRIDNAALGPSKPGEGVRDKRLKCSIYDVPLDSV